MIPRKPVTAAGAKAAPSLAPSKRAALLLCLLIGACGQYSASYRGFEAGQFQALSYAVEQNACTGGCRLRAEAARGIVLTGRNQEPAQAYEDLRATVTSPDFALAIPPNQQQRVLNTYCLASYNLWHVQGSKPGSAASAQQAEADCAKADAATAGRIQQRLLDGYRKQINALVGRGAAEPALRLIAEYSQLPGHDPQQVSAWEAQIGKSGAFGAPASAAPGPAAPTATTQLAPAASSRWYLISSGADADGADLGEPRPLVLGVFGRRGDCLRAAQGTGKAATPSGNTEAGGAQTAERPAERHGGLLRCVSSDERVWKTRPMSSMWLLLLPKMRWDPVTLSAACRPHDSAGVAKSWGIYQDARACERAKKSLASLTGLECGVCLPAGYAAPAR